MKQLTYKERLQKYAQMHADDDNKKYGIDMTWENYIDDAEVTIAAVAEAIREMDRKLRLSEDVMDVEKYLIENGYIQENKKGLIILVSLEGTYRDGGTQICRAKDGTIYYIDFRIGTKTPGILYTHHPGDPDARKAGPYLKTF